LLTVALAGSLATAVIGSAGAAPSSPVTKVHTYSVVGGSFGVIAVDQTTHLAYVSNDSLSTPLTEVINTKTGAHTDLTVNDYAANIAIDATTGLVYLPDSFTDTVVVLKGTAVLNTVHLAAGSQPFAVTINPTTGLVYVEDAAGKVAILKGSTLLKTITVGAGPLIGAVDPGTGDVYIPNSGSDTLSVIKGQKVINTVKTGKYPDMVAVDPARHLAYVANLTSGTVSVLHGSTLQGTAKVGTQPTGIAVDPVTHLAYVGNIGSSNVSILDGTTVKATVKVGPKPGYPAVDPSTGVVVFPSDGSTTDSVLVGLKRVRGIVATQGKNVGAGIDSTDGRLFISSAAGTIIEFQIPLTNTLTVTRPTAGHYQKGATVKAKFSCAAGTNNTVIACKGSTPNGHALPTSSVGVHHFTVTMTSGFGAKVTKTVTYHVTA
jgi:YVTN family beta-propeller protein